jgi:hypothetical protein
MVKKRKNKYGFPPDLPLQSIDSASRFPIPSSTSANSLGEVKLLTREAQNDEATLWPQTFH